MEVNKDLIAKAAQLINSATYTVALTGAGISTPSGIPDFRSQDAGIWQKLDPMEVASITAFKRTPQVFYEWIRPLAQTLMNARPNPAHDALAKLEKLGKLMAVITQNIDMLHTRAGSEIVYEVHGHLRKATCIKCYKEVPAEDLIKEFIADKTLSLLRCEACGGILKPNVILYGEQLPAMILNAAEKAARQCDLMLVAGSSLEVYPAADLPRKALSHGAKLIVVNFEETFYDRYAEVVIRSDVAEVLPQIVNAVEAKT